MCFRLIHSCFAVISTLGLMLWLLITSETTHAGNQVIAPSERHTTHRTHSSPNHNQPGVDQSKIVLCAACHGVYGNATDPRYPKLAGQVASFIVLQLQHFKSGKRHNPVMQALSKTLSKQDIHQLGSYFARQQVQPTRTSNRLNGDGRKLYREGDAKRGIPACTACHGSSGHGNPGAKYPRLSGQFAQYTEKTLRYWHNGGHEYDAPAYDEIMPMIGKRLNMHDITALSRYIEAMPTQNGTDRRETNLSTPIWKAATKNGPLAH